MKSQMETTTMPSPAPVHVATLVLAVACMLMLARMLKQRTKNPPAHRLPPSPPSLPVVGNLHQLVGGFPHRRLHALAASYGPVMLLRLGRVPTLVISSAASAQEVLQVQDHAFANRPSLAIPRKLLYGCTDIAFAAHGAYWRHARKLAVLHLLSPSRVRAYRDVREEEVAELVRKVKAEQVHGGVVRLSELLSGFAKDLSGRIVLGVRASGEDGWRGKVDALLLEANALLATFHVGDYFPWLAWVAAMDGTDAKVAKAFQTIDQILEEILDAASADMAAGAPRQDQAFVQVLLFLQRNSNGTGCRLSRDNVKALLEDLFGAGTDSTIIFLEWAMAELLRNKGAMQKLQQEIKRHSTNRTADHSLVVTEQDLPSMEYLRAVIKETMRLHPPSPFLLPRESMQHATVQGYDIPHGTRVVVNAWSIGRDPAVWAHSHEFRPERFVGSNVDFRGRHPQLIPFGAGRRMCPSVGYTTAVMELALANLVGQFDWAVPLSEDGAPGVVDMEEAPGFTLRKMEPLRAMAVWPA